MSNVNQLILAGIILLTYFVGKLQNNQNRIRIFQMVGTRLPKQVNLFNLRAEIIVIALSLLIFMAFNFAPEYAENPISLWFYKSIIDIEDTPVFGFIFKVIGFFFLLNMIAKMVNGLTFILSGGKTPPDPFERFNNKNDEDDDDFDDFEEIR